jgi:hypothetical protein
MGVHLMAEGAIVSYGPVLMRPWLVRCHSGPSDRGGQKSSTSSELTSRKLSDCQAWKSSALGVVPGDGTEVRRGNTYEQGESRMDRCPLTPTLYTPAPSSHPLVSMHLPSLSFALGHVH